MLKIACSRKDLCKQENIQESKGFLIQLFPKKIFKLLFSFLCIFFKKLFGFGLVVFGGGGGGDEKVINMFA